MGGGTGTPESFFTAANLAGQTSRQVPQFVHLVWSMTWIVPFPPTIASAGHLRRQIRHAWHCAGSM
jgi:hypothetical protein